MSLSVELFVGYEIAVVVSTYDVCRVPDTCWLAGNLSRVWAFNFAIYMCIYGLAAGTVYFLVSCKTRTRRG